jgi:cell division protein FtsI (penicillin-binding protein 3)
LSGDAFVVVAKEVISENLNYATRVTEPGSTFKLVTLLNALEYGVKLEDKINIEGGLWSYGGKMVKDAETSGTHETTVLHAFEESSNVGMAKLIVDHFVPNPQIYYKQLSKLRMDSTSGIDLMGEGRPQITRPGNKLWAATTLPWMGFGYNIAIAPVQTLALYNAIANNGVMMRPYLVNAIKDQGKLIKSIEPKAYPWEIASPNTIKSLRIALEGVCINGTAKKLFANSLYKVAGKTGTALVSEGAIAYKNNKFQSSFVGYFPAENPQYTIAVIIINHPNNPTHYGASVAGPVWKEIADRLYSTFIQNKLEVTPTFKLKDSQTFNYALSKNNFNSITKHIQIPFKDSSLNYDWLQVQGVGLNVKTAGQNMDDKAMPNIIGMKLQDAIWLCEKMGLMVKCYGKGKVVSQSLAQGQAIIKGQQIQIQLN